MANIYWLRGVFVCLTEDIHKQGYFAEKTYFTDDIEAVVSLTKLTARIATECESKAEGNVPSAFWIFKGKNVGKVVLKVK